MSGFKISTLSAMKQRVVDKGIRATDFRKGNLLTDSDIGLVTDQHMFEWVKTGQVRFADFKRWTKIKQDIVHRADLYGGEE